MATPIKTTPVLKGNSAQRFINLISDAEQVVKVTPKEKAALKGFVAGILGKAKI